MNRKRVSIFAVLLLDIGFCFVPLLRAAHACERLNRVVSAVKLVATLSRE